MGVPDLIKFWGTNVKDAYLRFREGEIVFPVDHLYIDGNGIIHGCAQQVFNYGEVKTENYAFLSYQEKINLLFQLVMDKINNYCQICLPQKTLYIAIDGSAPFSKQIQQRQRRYNDVIVPYKAGIVESEEDFKDRFSSTYISPGTPFMIDLCNFIRFNIIKKIQNDDIIWRKLKVVFSTFCVPGEGEHKILEYIREQPINDDSHCILSPDGDLLILGMGLNLKNIYVLRSERTVGSYSIIDINVSKQKINDSLNTQRNNPDFKRMVNDFVLMSFFEGNDFLPRVTMFTNLEFGFFKMYKIYNELAQDDEKFYLTENKKINIKTFTVFVEKIAKFEVDALLNLSTDVTDETSKYYYKTLNKYVITVSKNNKLDIELDFDGFRRAYYLKCNFPVEKDFEKAIRDLCLDYLKTYVWNLEYYLVKLNSWTWRFPNYYAPLMFDVAAFLGSITQEEIDYIYDFPPDEPSDIMLQLLSIFPKERYFILPPEYHPLMRSPESPLIKMGFYPDPNEVKIDYEGKIVRQGKEEKDFKAIVKLPIFDYHDIKSEYDKFVASNKINSKKFSCSNKVDIFYFDKEKSINYNSKYGSLRGSSVVKK